MRHTDEVMRQRVTLVTLGVRDLARARRFYEALGWETGAAPGDDVVFFQAGELVVGLWDRARLAEDSCVEDGGRGGDDRPRACADVLGWLQLRLHRPGRAPLGGRPQPALDAHG